MSSLEVVWVMAVVTEEERLNDRLVDHRGDDRDPRGVWLSRRLIHHKLGLFVSPMRKKEEALGSSHITQSEQFVT